MTVIEKQTAQKLGLCEKSVGTREAQGCGGTLSSTMTIVESMKVADVEVKAIQVGVLDLSNLMKTGCMEAFAGIIGFNFEGPQSDY